MDNRFLGASAPLFTGWFLGLLLGMRHALEPDHLAAVSTLLTQNGRSRRAALLGAFWGAGHSIALLIVGCVLFVVRGEMPSKVADLFELGVAFMLLILGARGMRRALQDGAHGPRATHKHGDLEHSHSGAPDHLHIRRWTLARSPFLIGLVHGLAGSGALTALALASMPTLASSLLYIALFGLGSIAGMGLLMGLAGLSMRRIIRSERAQARLALVASAVSIVLGVAWGAPLIMRLLGAST